MPPSGWPPAIGTPAHVGDKGTAAAQGWAGGWQRAWGSGPRYHLPPRLALFSWLHKAVQFGSCRERNIGVGVLVHHAKLQKSAVFFPLLLITGTATARCWGRKTKLSFSACPGEQAARGGCLAGSPVPRSPCHGPCTSPAFLGCLCSSPTCRACSEAGAAVRIQGIYFL